MKIGIIVEGNAKIGLGHIIRCKAIAEYLENKRTEVAFILPETVDQSLTKGFKAITVSIEKWNRISDNKEYFKAILQDYHGVLLDLVEKRFVDFSFLSSFPLYIASLTLFQFKNENYFGNISFFPTVDKFHIKVNQTEIYAGPEFFIIHDKIRKVQRKLSLKNSIPKILISMGGADPCDITTVVIRSTDLFNFDFKAIVIGGNANKNKERIKSLVERKTNFIYYDFVNNIESIYSEIDFAIINGGNTRYELTYLEIPYACISMHDVQHNINKKVTDLFGGLNIGIYNEISDELISDEIHKTINSPQKMEKITQAMRKFQMGNGHEIIGKTIIDNIHNTSFYEKND